ncbi:hypothetical protein BOTBODRAFT_33098 [Botryobasidium botryosum FD-172 SS1]|uniref:Uncharacterized protein n=1 Tax=Botryobasidium botryosum (strain FD-172 SS1) TaxID=930990 RepID=A0A067MQ23_BOTB1|nr:hypothetical protein BOTBODRAFT_33098 [Botryobasidium botryosum FD-172 SS1]
MRRCVVTLNSTHHLLDPTNRLHFGSCTFLHTWISKNIELVALGFLTSACVLYLFKRRQPKTCIKQITAIIDASIEGQAR